MISKVGPFHWLTTINFCDGTAADDIIGHEWAHAYTQYTNNLVYAWQSGAINEAYSDIWGETIDLLNNYDDDDNILLSIINKFINILICFDIFISFNMHFE